MNIALPKLADSCPRLLIARFGKALNSTQLNLTFIEYIDRKDMCDSGRDALVEVCQVKDGLVDHSQVVSEESNED